MSRSAPGRTARPGREPSSRCSASGSWWKAWYQNSRWGDGPSTRSPAPGSGGARTSARTRSGRSGGRGPGGARAHVVAGQHGRPGGELLDQREDAAGLSLAPERGRLRAGSRLGLPEPAQVRDHDPAAAGQQGDDVAPVVAVARPAVQQHDRPRAAGVVVVGEPETVDGVASRHAMSLQEVGVAVDGVAVDGVGVGVGVGEPRRARRRPR